MDDKSLIYVGTFTQSIRFGTGEILEGKGEGIHCFELNHSKGELQPYSVTSKVKNPSYLIAGPCGTYVYAVNELKTYQGQPTGTVSSFAADESTGELKLLNRKQTHGTDPCHLTINSNGNYVVVTNFMSGSVALFPVLADGSFGEIADFHQHHGMSVDPRRQAGPHAHSAVFSPDEEYVFVPDLGVDRVKAYRFDEAEGRLVPNEEADVSIRPGAGPRQLVFHPSGHYAYAVNELDSTLVAFTYEPHCAAFEEIGTVSTLPGGFLGENTCAEVRLHPEGRFLYASNRGHNSLAIYEIAPENGTLHLVGHQQSGGKTPRGFAVHPYGDVLIVGNQDSDLVAVFSIDVDTGMLTQKSSVYAPTPVCILPSVRNE